MQKHEIVKLIALCSANYRDWPEDGKENAVVELWETMLSDIPFAVGLAAVKIHMSRSVFPPTVADIRNAAAQLTQPRIMDAIEAWDLIVEAIRKYGYYREEEALASLPDDVAEMARRFKWRELCLSENVDTLRAQFRMAWETKSKRRQEESLFPNDIVALMESAQTVKQLKSG